MSTHKLSAASVIAALGVTMAVAQLSAQTPPGASLATLTGRVTNSVSGEPVRRAKLSLNSLAGGGGSLGATSGADGGFVFPNVPPGVYRLNAERIGFIAQEYGARSPLADGARLELSPGQNLKGIEFPLAPQGALSGRVLDSEGDPASNVTVRAFRQSGSGTTRKLVPSEAGESNDLGDYRIPGLSPGNYVLVADRTRSSGTEEPSAPASPQEQDLPTFYPSSTSLHGSVEIPIAIGQESPGRDIRIQKGPVAPVQGRVTGPAAMLRSLQLILFPGDPAEASLGLNEISTTIGPDGSFRLEDVPTGIYRLTALLQAGRQQILGTLPLAINGQPIRDLSFAIAEPGDLTGVVRWEDAPKPSTAAMSVRVTPSDAPPVPIPGEIQRDGAFRIAGVSRIPCRVSVYGLPPGAYVKAATAAGKDVLENGLDLRAGALSPVEITLSSRGGTVAGSVMVGLQGGDKPAPGSVVVLTPDAQHRNQLLYRKTTADDSASFEVTGLAPGAYNLYAFPEGTELDPFADGEILRSLENAAVKIIINEGGREHADLKLVTN